MWGLAAFLPVPASTVGWRCFPTDTRMTRLCGGRQAERTLTRRSASDHRISHCHGLCTKSQQQQSYFSPAVTLLKPKNESCGRQTRGRRQPLAESSYRHIETPKKKPLVFFFSTEGKTASGLRRSSEVGDPGRSNAHRFWWVPSL